MNSKQKRKHRRQVLHTWGEQVADAIALAKLRGQEHVICNGHYFTLRTEDPVYSIAKNLGRLERTFAQGSAQSAIDGTIIDEHSVFKLFDEDRAKRFFDLGKALRASTAVTQTRRESPDSFRLLRSWYGQNIRGNQGISYAYSPQASTQSSGAGTQVSAALGVAQRP